MDGGGCRTQSSQGHVRTALEDSRNDALRSYYDARLSLSLSPDLISLVLLDCMGA